MNNIIITGCAGFIGSHATDIFLSEPDYRVIGVDSLTYAGDLKNISEANKNKNFKFFKLDICETENIVSLARDNKVTEIINFAAETHVDNSILSSKSFIHSNIEGVRSLLEVCRSEEIRLIHVSTDEVYGSTRSNSFVESDRLSPSNPYSATKASAEHLIKAYENTHNVKNIIVRPANNFGPRQHREKFLPTIINSIYKGKKIPIYGNGQNIRDWLYVKDTARVIKFLLESELYGEIYNISPSNEMTNLNMVKKILKKTNKDWKSSVSFVDDRLGHDFRYSISSEKLDRIYDCSFSNFDECLEETIDYYRFKK
tara:strand:- start:5013 stop:5951 length:939 start_codon:yes stop_codon:yes gene_type:complete